MCRRGDKCLFMKSASQEPDATVHVKRNWSESNLLFSLALCASVDNLPLEIFNFIPLNIYPPPHLCTVYVGCLIISMMDNHHWALWIAITHQIAESIPSTSRGKHHIPILHNVWITFGCSPPQWSRLVCRDCTALISPADTHIPVMEGETLAAGAGGVWRYMMYMPIRWPHCWHLCPSFTASWLFYQLTSLCVCTCVHKNIYSQCTCVFIDMSVCIH